MSTNLKAALLIGCWLTGICASACGPPQGSTLTVHVTGWEDGDGALQIVPRISGRLGQTHQVDPGKSEFSITFDLSQTNAVVLDGLVSQSNDCRYATGSADATFKGNGESENISKDMILTHYSKNVRQCPTENCGLNQWCQQELVTGHSLQGVWANNENVWAVGFGGMIVHGLRQKDGSFRWQYEESPTTDTLNSIDGSGPDNLWAVGFNGRVIHFDGTKWSVSPNAELGNAVLNAVGVRDLDTEVLVGGNNLFGAKGLPTQWRIILPPLTENQIRPLIRSMWRTTSGGWVVGDKQHIEFVNIGNSAAPVTIPSPVNPMQLNGVWATSKDLVKDWIVWAVGQNGIICSGKNDIPSWSCSSTAAASQGTLYSVSGDAGRMQVWAVGENGKIWFKNSTVITEKVWIQSDSGTTQQLNSVFAVSGGSVWAIGNNGTILRYN